MGCKIRRPSNATQRYALTRDDALQEIQELQEKVSAMRSEPSPLEAARAELAACEGDRQKFLRLLEQLQVRVLPHALVGKQNSSLLLLPGLLQLGRLMLMQNPPHCVRSRHLLMQKHIHCGMSRHGLSHGRARCGMQTILKPAGEQGSSAQEGAGAPGRHARKAAGARYCPPGQPTCFGCPLAPSGILSILSLALSQML